MSNKAITRPKYFYSVISSGIKMLALGAVLGSAVGFASDYESESEPEPVEDDFANGLTGLQEEYQEVKREFEQLKLKHQDKVKSLKNAQKHITQFEQYFLRNINTPIAVVTKDKIASQMIELMAIEQECIFLAIGNTQLNYDDPANSKVREQLTQFLERLKRQEVFVAYDADSQASSIVEHIIPPTARVGISGRVAVANPKRGPIYVISNSFLRMDTILKFRNIVLAPDSILAIGLLMQEYTRQYPRRFFIIDSKKLAKGLHKWAQSLDDKSQEIVEKEIYCYECLRAEESKQQHEEKTSYLARLTGKKANKPNKPNKPNSFWGQGFANSKKDTATKVAASIIEAATGASKKHLIKARTDFRNLGIVYEKPEISVYNYANLASNLNFPVRKRMPEYNMAEAYIFAGIRKLKTGKIKEIIRKTEEYLLTISHMRMDPQLNGRFKGGLAFFGSKQPNPHFMPIVRNSIEAAAHLGIPVTTGGESGLMQLANQVAKSQGSYSVGVVLDEYGHYAERHYEHHSKTIIARGYEQRIPFLQDNKIMFVVGPGGAGTKKEVAATFVDMASKASFDIPIAFLHSDYYGPLVGWLNSLKLPAQFLEQIHIISRAEDMTALLGK